MESTKIFVANLPERMDEEELREMFSKYGPIKNVSIKKKNSVFGFIEFQDSRDAESALKEDGADVSGHKIRVEKSNPRQRDDRDSYRRDDYRNSRRSRSRDRRDDRRDDRRPSYRDNRDYQSRDGFRERPSGCFNCKQEGHIAKNCPEPKQEFNRDARKPLTCFVCGKEGHKKFDCPQADSRGQRNGGDRGDRGDRRDNYKRSRSRERRRRSSSSSYKGRNKRRSPSYDNRRSNSKSNS